MVSACGTSTLQPGAGAPLVAAVTPLASLVAPTPPGFTAEATDMNGGGMTGKIGLPEASSADCDGVGQIVLHQDRWAASELRYFDNNAAYPRTYILLCVTQLHSSADASANQRQLIGVLGHSFGGLPAPAPFPVPGIPGASGYSVGPASEIFFARSTYFVFVVSAGASPAGLAGARTLATGLASTESQRLPA